MSNNIEQRPCLTCQKVMSVRLPSQATKRYCCDKCKQAAIVKDRACTKCNAEIGRSNVSGLCRTCSIESQRTAPVEYEPRPCTACKKVFTPKTGARNARATCSDACHRALRT